MPKIIHYEYEVLYGVVSKTACGAKPGKTNCTSYDAYVTCPKCLSRLGYAQQIPS